MLNLTNLVIQYKQSKDKSIIDKIYTELKSIIQQKAKFIYYAKWYPMNLYHKCKHCRNCEKLNNVPKSEHNLICKDCNECNCIKGFFNLKKSNLCEYEDVENDIWLEIMRTIENFDITKDFNTYLFSNLWEFIPSFITKNFVKSLLNKSLTKVDSEGNETEMEIADEEEKDNQFDIETIIKLCKTEQEKEIIQLLIKGLKQKEIAEKLEVSEQYISKKLIKLRKQLKKIVDF
jgi:RNA polymerase sigma factor (sigma-70 family)